MGSYRSPLSTLPLTMSFTSDWSASTSSENTGGFSIPWPGSCASHRGAASELRAVGNGNVRRLLVKAGEQTARIERGGLLRGRQCEKVLDCNLGALGQEKLRRLESGL